jgi:2,4-dienoyl-CoA reductase-like NADH-dependent reductase (Old Yellow Enzyme family)
MTQDIIFKPLEWRNLTVKNRLFRSSISGRWDNYDGSGTQARLNWEEQFARGGIGAIISSYTPIHIAGRIVPNAAMIDTDERIPFWKKVGETVHRYDCKFILQLSHSGRQRDIDGVENTYPRSFRPTLALSSTQKSEQIHGFRCRNMTQPEIQQTVQYFADGARRAREAGLDGVELHSSHGYLITQFLSSGINTRSDEYGGSLENRYRFLQEIVHAIRKEVGTDFHLQAKISAVDYNNILPWEKRGNTLQDSTQICQWLERDSVDAIHVSRGSTFPHPLLPAGPFPFRIATSTYDTMISSTRWRTLLNYFLFRSQLLQPIFRYIWNRLDRPWHPPIQGSSIEPSALDPFFQEQVSVSDLHALLERYQGTVIEEAKVIKQHVNIPVICTGGFQQASFIRQAIHENFCDGVTIARPLVANKDLAHQFQAGKDIPDRPCTYCNQCLGSYLEYPLGCYELPRYYQRSTVHASAIEQEKAMAEAHDAMIGDAMQVYDPPPQPFSPVEQKS